MRPGPTRSGGEARPEGATQPVSRTAMVDSTSDAPVASPSKAQVSSVLVIILEIAPKDSAESLNIRILPRAMVCGQHLLDAHRLDTLSKPISINAVSIPKNVSWRRVPWERLNALLCCPFGRGIRRCVEVNDATPSVTHDDKQEQQPKSNGPCDKKVHANHVWYVVLDEGSPGLKRRRDRDSCRTALAWS